MNLMQNRFVVALLGFVAGVASLAVLAAAPPALSGAPHATTAPEPIALDLRRGFVGIADAVVPSVVRIETTRSQRGAARPSGIPQGFERFFDLPRGSESTPVVSGGTGFIVEANGLVLTNHHVVGGADRITVWLHDGRSLDAEFVGGDPTTDVAVLRVDAKGLSPIALADSDRVQVGEWVVAIGNPGFRAGEALDETVTAGIVSAIGRPLAVIRGELAGDPERRQIAQWAIEDFIQTDAVINPGNSGGPLVNLDGEVVGMNTAIASSSGYYQGYGFSIPINLVRRVMDDLVRYGHVRRAWLGVQITDVTAEDAEAFGLRSVSGVVVQGVTMDGPGDEAGLQQGDVILSVDGQVVDRVGALQQLIARSEPGARVELEVVRGRDVESVRVRLGEAPIETESVPAARSAGELGDELVGLRFGEATSEGVVGVYVTGVDPAGPAARRGVARGARVTEINGAEVQSIDDVEEALERVEPGDIVSLVFEVDETSSRIVNLRARSPRQSGG